MEITREQVQLIADSVPGHVAIYRYDGEHAETLYLSPSMAALNGMTWDEYEPINRANSVAMVVPEDLPDLVATIRSHIKAKTTESFDAYFRVLHKLQGFDWAHAVYRICGYMEGAPVFVALFTNASMEMDIYQELLNSTDRRIYVCDRHTYEILYANKLGRDFAKEQNMPLYQAKCYSFIRGRASLCGKCWLNQGAAGDSVSRKIYDPERDVWELVEGRFINWCGHEAFVQFIADITETEQQQRQLKQIFTVQDQLAKNIRLLNGNAPFKERIQQVLCNLGEFFQADRAYMFTVDGNTTSNRFEWCRSGIEAQIDKRQRLDSTYINSWRQAFDQGKCLIVSDIEQIKSVYPGEYAVMMAQGIHSYMEAPILIRGTLRGFIGVDNPALDAQTQLDDLLLSLAYAITDEVVKEESDRALRESQERYETAIDGAQLAVWEYHIKEHRMLSTSERIRQYHVPEVIEHMPEDFLGYFPEEERPKLIHFFERIDGGEPIVADDFWVQWTPDSPAMCEHSCFSVIKDEQGEPVVAYGVSIDVTAQKQRVRQYDQTLELLLRVNPEALGMLHFNLTKNIFIDGHGATSEVKQIISVQTFDAFVANVARRICDDDSRQQYKTRFNRQGLMQLFADGTTTAHTDVYRDDGEGKKIWVRIFYHLLENPDTRDVESVVYSLDISREKQREDIFRIITGQEYDLISLIHFDTEDYEIVHKSPNLPDLLQRLLPAARQRCRLHEFMDQSIREWIHPDDAALYAAHGDLKAMKRLLDKNGRYEFTIRYRVSDTSEGVRYRKYQHYYLNEKKETILVIQSDVTALQLKQQKELQQEQKLRRQAVAANVAKTEFLSRMSHDIRTPLNGIMGMTYIASQEDNPEKTQKCLRNIDISSKFLLGLVNDVLDMSKAESGRIKLHLEPYPREEFLEYLQAVIRQSCEEKKLEFCIEITPGPQVMVPLMDKLRINQIYFNLLSNAIKFTPAGGRITFHLEQTYKTDEGKLHIETTVADTGVGISKQFQGEMFQPFSQEIRNDIADNRGSGLGLAIVQRLVDLIGGTITVTSEVGKGSSFTVIAEYDCIGGESPQPTVTDAETIDYRSLEGKRVLLCEDHPMNQDIMNMLLTAKGMAVEIASDGCQGVVMFEQSRNHYFDAILMDIRMPGMDGYEAAERIRAMKRADAALVPIIATTADAFSEDVQKCLAVGMNDHVSKPVDPAKLFAVLSKWISVYS